MSLTTCIILGVVFTALGMVFAKWCLDHEQHRLAVCMGYATVFVFFLFLGVTVAASLTILLYAVTHGGKLE